MRSKFDDEPQSSKYGQGIKIGLKKFFRISRSCL